MADKILYIIRGVPGSGKSTLAHKLSPIVVEADDFMMVDGEYKYDPKKVHYCHKKCFETVKNHLKNGEPIVAVANTFIKKSLYAPYVDLANEYGYKVIIRKADGNYQNIHNVPADVVNTMRKRFQECMNEVTENDDKNYYMDAMVGNNSLSMAKLLSNGNEHTGLLSETLKKVSDESYVMEITSYNDIKPFIKRYCSFGARGVLNTNNNKVYLADSMALTHGDMVDDLIKNGEQIDYDSIIRFMVYPTYETAIDSEYGEYWNNNEDNRIDFLTNKDLYVLFKQYSFMNDRLNKILKLDTMEDVEKNETLYEEYEGLNESIAYAEMNDDDMIVILHNPTRKELKDNHLDDECRIVYDGNNGYYFASSEWTHEQIEQKLQANNLPYTETSGEFYYYQDNLFATRDDWSSEEEYQEYKNDWYQSLKSMPYVVKNFGNFKVEIFRSEYLSEEYEGLNRIAGFYWFDRHNWLEDGHFQLLKRKPVGVEELDPEDNDFDYYHLDDIGLEEDNKARFGIEKIGKKIVCYIESISKNHCLKAKKAIQKKFNNIVIDKFQLSWGRDGFEELDESIVYAERSDDYYDDSEYQDMTNIILKNPTRKELQDNGMIECRIVKDWDGNFYFANSYEMIHTDIVDKLESENITSVETNLFYDANSNTFYYNVGHLTDDEIKDFSEREEKELRHSSYISKTFKDFQFKIIFGEL